MSPDFQAGPDRNFYWPRYESRKRAKFDRDKFEAELGVSDPKVVKVGRNDKTDIDPVPSKEETSKRKKARTASAKTKAALVRRDGLWCYLCGKEFSYVDLRVEHKIPRSRGGTNVQSNLGLACAPCDIAKEDMTPQEYWAKLTGESETKGQTIKDHWPS